MRSAAAVLLFLLLLVGCSSMADGPALTSGQKAAVLQNYFNMRAARSISIPSYNSQPAWSYNPPKIQTPSQLHVTPDYMGGYHWRGSGGAWGTIRPDYMGGYYINEY